MLGFTLGGLWLLSIGSALADDPVRVDTSEYSNRQILLGLFEAAGGLDWADSIGWFQGTDVCAWNGVNCYDENIGDARKVGHIREISLPDNHLVGTVPSIVFEIPYLEVFDVSDNHDVDVDMSLLSRAEHMTHFDISNTRVTKIDNIGDASNLEVLHITGLGLTGNMPPSLFTLSRLIGLFANDNSFSGTLPTLVGRLTNLDELYLYGNDLTGQIPDEIRQMTSLQVLTLSNNAFGGILPADALNSMTYLEVVAIQRDDVDQKGPGISGPVPSFQYHRNLKGLYLENQRLSGNLDPDFLLDSPTSETVEVDLSSNMLTGEVPSSLIDKNYLTLFLADNQISQVATEIYNPSTGQCSRISRWMDGDVGSIGCDAFLCPPGTWAPPGHATSDYQCQSCSDDAVLWGRTSCTSTTPSNVQERQILINFYNIMGGRSWKNDDNWLSPDQHVCTWYGVSCNDSQRVSSINLRNNGLSGTPPPEFFSLPELRTLNLESNPIGFDFQGISVASKLEVLILSSTNLASSSLSDLNELSSLSTLRVLSLASNNLGGNVPSDLFTFTGLVELDISHNSFSGQLSSNLGQLRALQRFACDGNQLTGQFPEEIGNLSNLQDLSAGENQFGGTLPTELNSLSNLRSISLQQVIAEGGIGGPMLAFRDHSQLTSLQFGSNQLTGTLPANFLVNSLHLDATIVVGLSDNILEGEIPSQWSRFDKLVVDLTANKITSIAPALCDKDDWMDGDVDKFGCNGILCPVGRNSAVGRQTDVISQCDDCPGNQGKFMGATSCTGDEPSYGDHDGSELNILSDFFAATVGSGWTQSDGWSLSNDVCTYYGVECDGGGRVTKIDLSDNGLRGTVPGSIFTLPALRELILSKNDASVTFDSIGEASSLVSLYLDDMNLDSIDGLGSAPSLITLHLEDNNLKGGIPVELYLLSNLRDLDLGYNHLSGKLPNVVGLLTSLESLLLYHNQFTGRLPAALGDLTNLRVLNLAENNFEGTIPPELNDLVNLRFLSLQREGGILGTDDVGINQGGSSHLGGGLSGPLPSFDQLTQISELYLGVNSLSGSIPFNFLDGVSVKSSMIKIDLISNQLTGTIPASLSQFGGMSIYVADNRISAIADGLCGMSAWLDGDVGSHECDGILCPVNRYSAVGRETDAASCQSCSSGTNGYMGSFECLSGEEHQGNSKRAILEKLYRETNGQDWLDNTNWMDPDESICTWFGVDCNSDDQSVTSVNLENNRLTGSFPSDVFGLPNLQSLILEGNDMAFSFEQIEQASNLKYLDIEDMGLSSLQGVSKASQLSVLRADRNSLMSFPDEVFDMSSLEVLSMSENPFAEQAIPEGLQGLVNLDHFSCGNCGFNGELPTWIGAMNNLEYIRLDQNALSGNLPTELLSLENLRHLDLSDQRTNGRAGLTGGLLDFSLQENLRELLLRHNQLTGPIPSNLLQSVSTDELVTIDLSYNFLKDPIPAELSHIDSLNLYVVENAISEIPPVLCTKDWNDGNVLLHNCDGILCRKGTFNSHGRAIGTLDCLPCAQADELGTTVCGDIYENSILVGLYRSSGGTSWNSDEGWLRGEDHCTWEGITCHQDGEYKGLVQKIELGDNNLVGRLKWGLIWNLEGLEYIDLQKNDVSIDFANIELAKELKTIILSETATDSLVDIGAAGGSLKELHLTNCKLNGAIPDELYELTLLEKLYVSHNELTGTLSTLIGQLKQLQDLYMFGNSLEATLPSELGFLAAIQHLSLGENKFTESIPRQLFSLPNLELLSLQNERDEPDGDFSVGGGGLTGTLPAFAFPRISELYLGHNSLTGTIPEHFLESVNDKSLLLKVDLSYNNLSGSIPKDLAEFDDLQLLLARNQISGIPDEICAKHTWMNGEVADGCDAILCSPGTFNEFGRRVDSETPCTECTYRGSSVDYGSTSCGPPFKDLDDGSILLELYDATDGSEWYNNEGWIVNNDHCKWYGVTCETVEFGVLSVTELELVGNNLNGMIPSALFHLPDLRTLRLGDNNVEVGLGAVFRAENLEDLYLDNTLVHSLDGVGRASSLKVLHLQKNSFGWDSVPEELFDLTNLEDLDLSDSMFSGSLSTSIGNLVNLRSLSLVGNAFSGQVPDEIGNLGLLEELHMSNNKWFGTIPATITNLVSLQRITVDNGSDAAGLSGPLSSFTEMPKLREIRLSRNQLTGTIPDAFLAGVDDVERLITIYLDGNSLVGTIPSQLTAFKRLNLYLEGNLFTDFGDGVCTQSEWMDGAVEDFGCDAILCPAGEYNPLGRQTSQTNDCDVCPGSEGSPILGGTFCLSIQKELEREVLEKLYRDTDGDNWREKDGWMDDAFDICRWHGISCKQGSSVESILLVSNQLVGTLPTEIYEFPNLKFLWVYSNHVDVSFEGISQATNLQSLSLDSTKVRSLDGIGDGVSLKDVSVRFNNLHGPIPEEISKLVNLESFTCSENLFTGEVPELAALRKLSALRMGNNKLSGSLPSFSQHRQLNSLDLSSNDLVGPIPSNFLQNVDEELAIFLDLSNNALTGTVPGELSRFADLTLYLRENLIEGIDPGLCMLEQWNGGDVGRFHCDGILCPPKSYSSTGRASQSGATCRPCSKNNHYGGTRCGSGSSSGATSRFCTVSLLAALVVCVVGLFQ